MSRSTYSLIFLISLIFLSCNTTYKQGQRLYELRCANCHMDDASGVDNLIPSLDNSKYLGESVNELPCLIYTGIPPDSTSEIRTTVAMQGQKDMTASEISNIVNYLQWLTEKKGVYLSDQEVEDLLENCQ